MHHSFRVSPGPFDGVRMSSSLRILKFNEMINGQVLKSMGVQTIVVPGSIQSLMIGTNVFESRFSTGITKDWPLSLSQTHRKPIGLQYVSLCAQRE